MEDGQVSRFVCKLCNRKFPCGKSLGGHMRSHVVNSNGNTVESERISALEDYVDVLSSYGLRENPRKTWRVVDSRPRERVCKQCGKGFQSMKALCGHMACHSDKDRDRDRISSFKDDHSWTSENQKLVMDSHSDTEVEEDRRLLRRRSCNRNKSIKIDDSSSVSEIDGQDQEEVALCLMLLSMDKNGVNSVVEYSDNNSVVLETKSSSNEMKKLKDANDGVEIIPRMEDSDSGYFLEECTKVESDASFDGFGFGFGESKRVYDYNNNAEVRKSLRLIRSIRTKANEYDDDGEDGFVSNFGAFESKKRKYASENGAADNQLEIKKSKYECFNCKKSFKSYQALGGHRPCHKKSNASYESGENSLDDYNEYRGSGKFVESSKRLLIAKNEKKMKPKNNKGHVCPFCNRVFKNGQALGGHKRSHFIGGHVDESNHRSSVVKPDLLDLNLPAPEVGENDERGKFFPW